MRRSVTLLALWLLACEDEVLDREGGKPVLSAPTDDELGAIPVERESDGFIFARGVTMLAAHVPTRFEIRLPIVPGPFAGDGSIGELPFAYFEARLCANDEAMRARVIDALQRHEEGEQVEQFVVDSYTDLLATCPSANHCAWLAEQAQPDARYWVRMPLASAALWCDRAAIGDLLERDDAPQRAAVIWHRHNVPVSGASVPAALVRAVRSLDPAQDGALADAAVVLARYPGAEATALLAELQAAADRNAAAALDSYGYESEAAPLLEQACDFLAVAPQCAALRREYTDTDLIAHSSETQYEQALLDPKRAAKANFILGTCVRDIEEVEPRRQHCLARLAARDWAAAQQVALEVTAAEPAFRESLRIVTSFASREAFRRELAELGLISDHVQATFQETISLTDELMRSRRLLLFGGRSGSVPVRHDALLFELASLAGAAMNDVVFEQLPPSEIDEIYDSSPYVLRAYADGKRWSLTVDVIDDFYAVRETIGLLNLVAAERGSDLRWVALRDDTQYAVIVAPREGIARAVDRGFIELAEL